MASARLVDNRDSTVQGILPGAAICYVTTWNGWCGTAKEFT